MSVVVKARPRLKQRTWSTVALWIVLGLAGVFFLVRYGQELFLEHDLLQKAASQRVQNKTLEDEITRLQASLQYYTSDKYIEQRAREDLNLRRADEEVLIPVAFDDSTVPAAIGVQASAPSSMRDNSNESSANWQKWLGLFAPPGSP